MCHGFMMLVGDNITKGKIIKEKIRRLNLKVNDRK